MSWDDLHEPKGTEDRFKGGGGSQKPPFEIPQIKVPQFKPSMVMGVILLLLVLWIVPGTFYFVEPDEEGVVTRFGKFHRTTSPGLHFKFPSPIEHASTPKIRQVRRAEIGFRASEGRPMQRVPAESLMLTGDQNIIDINLVVQYRILDSVKYLFNVRRPHKLIRDSAETVKGGQVLEEKVHHTRFNADRSLFVLQSPGLYSPGQACMSQFCLQRSQPFIPPHGVMLMVCGSCPARTLSWT